MRGKEVIYRIKLNKEGLCFNVNEERENIKCPLCKTKFEKKYEGKNIILKGLYKECFKICQRAVKEAKHSYFKPIKEEFVISREFVFVRIGFVMFFLILFLSLFSVLKNVEFFNK